MLRLLCIRDRVLIKSEIVVRTCFWHGYEPNRWRAKLVNWRVHGVWWRREWIPSCLASLLISWETGVNGDTLSGCSVTSVVSSTMRQRNGWTRRQSLSRSWAKLCRRAERQTKRFTWVSPWCVRTRRWTSWKESGARAALSAGADFVRSMVLRLGRRCTSTRISWSMTAGNRMASRRNCWSGRTWLPISRKRPARRSVTGWSVRSYCLDRQDRWGRTWGFKIVETSMSFGWRWWTAWRQRLMTPTVQFR